MRRNMGRRGGNSSGAGGPLMTGHLKDIDLELELLKRKREMIEQQQQLLVMEQQYKSKRHYDPYDQTRFDEPEQHGSNRNFANSYDNGPQHRNQFGKKRQAEFQWQYESPAKRTAPRKKNNQPHFNPHGPGNTGPANFRFQKPGPKSSPKRPAPLMDVKIKPSIGQKIANQKASQKEIATKVTKAFAASNKTVSQSSAERKANDSTSGDVSRMLLPDQVPTQQVSGRLELALGAIMKNIRALVPDDSKNAPMLRSVHLQRVMKQAIRERIRTVMLGKVVGSLNEILAIYRGEFPEETDMDIVNIALEAGGLPAQQKETKIKPKESGDPMEYFKRNMVRLLDTTLHEMFEKLEKIYNNNSEEPSVEASNSEAPENQTELNQTEQNQTEPAESGEQNNEMFTEEYKNFMNSTIKAREVKRIMPRLMKKYIPFMIKCLNVDAKYQNTEAAIIMKTNKMAAAIVDGQGKTTGDDASISMNESRQARDLPHFVKIMSRPSLPKKKAMQAFLNQFNPKSIKKHRSIHNLLFVGFSEKIDFDNMVAADGTVIGRSTLSVRVCTGKARDSTGENNESFAMDVGQEETKKNESTDSDIINAELDGQITDLLSSIRKSEEESRESADETEKKTENGENENETQLGEDGNVQEEDEVNQNAEKPDNVVNAEKPDNVVNAEQPDNVVNAEKPDNVANAEQPDNIVNAENKETIEVKPEDEKPEGELANNPEPQNSDETVAIDLPKSAETDTNSQVTSNGDTQDSEQPVDTTENAMEPEEKLENEKIGELKSNASGRSTPTRMSTRLASATPSIIRTRRASRLEQN